MHQFPKFTQTWNFTCFGQFLRPSSGVYSLHAQHWYMSYRFEDSFRAVPSWSCTKAVFKPVWHISVPNVQWINSWWSAEELPETCRVSCPRKFGKLVHLVGFVIKKFSFEVHHFPYAHRTYEPANAGTLKMLIWGICVCVCVCALAHVHGSEDHKHNDTGAARTQYSSWP